MVPALIFINGHPCLNGRLRGGARGRRRQGFELAPVFLGNQWVWGSLTHVEGYVPTDSYDYESHLKVFTPVSSTATKCEYVCSVRRRHERRRESWYIVLPATVQC
jgi:hypothetical protein